MKTTINIKADSEVKESAQEAARDLGVPLSVVLNALLKEFVRNRSFAVSSMPRMTPYLESIIGRVEKDLKQGKNISPVFSSAKAANDYLDSL